MKNPVNQIKRYYREVLQEVRKCAWPERQELMRSTMVVIMALVAMALFVFAVDYVAGQWVIPLIVGN